MKEIIINHLLNYEFVCLFLFYSFVFLFIAVFVKLERIRKISIALFSMFFVLFNFEFLLSFFVPFTKVGFFNGYIDACDVNHTSQHRHTTILSDNNESYNKWNINDIKDFNIDNYKLVFDKTYTLYENRFRFTKCNNNSEKIYIFLGCSIVFGIGIDDNETLPYYFSKLFNFNANVINCGVSGQSTNTVLNILNNDIFLPFIKNKNPKFKHFFFSLVDDHIYRNFRYEDKSFYNIMDGYLYKNKKWYIPTVIGKIKYIFARSYIFRKVFVPIIDEKFKQYYEDYLINSLKEINKIVEEKYKSKLTIMIWSQDFDEKFLKKLKTFEEENLDLIFLPEYFNSEDNGYTIKNDGHPTAKANEEIAQILYNHINNLE